VLPAGLGALMAQEGLLLRPGPLRLRGPLQRLPPSSNHTPTSLLLLTSTMSEVDDVEERALASLGVTPNRALRQADRQGICRQPSCMPPQRRRNSSRRWRRRQALSSRRVRQR